MSNPILNAALAALHADYTVTLGNIGAVVPERVVAPWLLARTADCAQPDGHEKEGQKFLTLAFSHFTFAVENDMNVSDSDDAADLRRTLEDFDWHEYADDAVPVYTHEKWLTFVHLAAYQEDVSDLVDSRKVDGDSVANAALYQIADRLFRALATELADKIEDSEHWTNHAAEIDAAEEQ